MIAVVAERPAGMRAVCAPLRDRCDVRRTIWLTVGGLKGR